MAPTPKLASLFAYAARTVAGCSRTQEMPRGIPAFAGEQDTWRWQPAWAKRRRHPLARYRERHDPRTALRVTHLSLSGSLAQWVAMQAPNACSSVEHAPPQTSSSFLHSSNAEYSSSQAASRTSSTAPQNSAQESMPALQLASPSSQSSTQSLSSLQAVSQIYRWIGANEWLSLARVLGVGTSCPEAA